MWQQQQYAKFLWKYNQGKKFVLLSPLLAALVPQTQDKWNPLHEEPCLLLCHFDFLFLSPRFGLCFTPGHDVFWRTAVGARHRERGWETVVCLGGNLRFALRRGELGGGAGNGCRPAPPRAPTVYFRTAQPLALRRMRGSALWGERRSREGRPARWGEGEGGRLGAARGDYRRAEGAGSSPTGAFGSGENESGPLAEPESNPRRIGRAGRVVPSPWDCGAVGARLYGPLFPRSPAVRPQREPYRTQAPFRSSALGSPSVQPGHLGGFWCISLRWKRARLETARHGGVWPAGCDLRLRAARSSRPLRGPPSWADGAERRRSVAATRLWDVGGTESCPVLAGMRSLELCCWVGCRRCYLRWNPAGTARPDEPTPGCTVVPVVFAERTFCRASARRWPWSGKYCLCVI